MSLLKIMPPGNGLNSMTEFDIYHPLPERTKQSLPIRNKLRRERRDLFQQIETILEDREFNGRSCIQKAICEAKSMNVEAHEDNLLHDLFRLIFQPLGKGSYSCQTSKEEMCPFSPLQTLLAWFEHFRRQSDVV